MEQTPYQSISQVMSQLVNYLPTLFAGFLVLAIGAALAWIAAKVCVRLLILLRLDRLAQHLSWGRALEKGDVRHSLFGWCGWIAGGLVFLIFLESAVAIWKLTVLSRLLGSLVSLIPQLVLAAVILLIGWSAAAVVSRSVQRTLVQEGFERARLARRIVYSAMLVLVFAIALVELGIAVEIVTGAFLITFGALALGFVLAFGLGSKRAVEFMWEEHFRRQKEEHDQKSAKP